MTKSDYSQLKDEVVRSIETKDNFNNLLQSIKELFKDGINSVRRFEQIRRADHLLHILELRGLLSEDDVSPLKLIARTVKNQTLLNKINEYVENHEPREYSNYYTSEKGNKSLSSSDFTSPKPIISGLCDKKKDRIFKTITEQIGSSWRDLARTLKISEYEIDNIDESHRTMATKASIMLDHFNKKKDSQRWPLVLCDALDKIRRKELRHTVQEIMMMNI